MRKIAIALCIVLLTGCGVKYVKVPVWTPPEINVPPRPVMVSDGKGTDGEVARNDSIDKANLEKYSVQLENIIKAVQAHSAVQNTEINK